MIKFGLIGGTSWHSTVDYYAAINRAINARSADNTNPRLSLVSLNQREIYDLQRRNDWDTIFAIFREAALELQAAHVAGIALCANTSHKIYDRLQAEISVPIVHIGDAIGQHLRRHGWTTVGLLGTRFTMEEDFLRGRLRERFGIETLVPPAPEREEIQRFVYDQLSRGQFPVATRDRFLEIAATLIQRGAQAIILGCTEFPILLRDATCPVPLVDSTECHCDAIVRFILDSAPARG